MTRIKYLNTHGLLHTDWFTVGPNRIIRGVIDSTNNYYEIRELDSVIIVSGRATNLRNAKDLIRKHLQASGVNFDGEIRRRT